jgi:hypothetical protein
MAAAAKFGQESDPGFGAESDPGNKVMDQRSEGSPGEMGK